MIKVFVAIAAINIGTITDTDKPVSKDYWIKNTGEYGWKVSQVYTSCGCTTTEYDKEKLVRQGDSICVTLTFNPEGRHGDFNQTGTVMITDGEEQIKTTLQIEGNIIRSKETIKRQFPYDCGNGILAAVNKMDFGVITTGKIKSKHIALYNTRNTTKNVAIKCNQPLSTAQTTIKIAPTTSVALEIFYDPAHEKNIGITENFVTIGEHCIKITARKNK